MNPRPQDSSCAFPAMISACVFWLLLGVVLAGHATAAEPKQETRSPAKQNQSNREAAALDFAQRHHPELAQLISKLQSTNRKAFDSAIKDLVRSAERLERMQSRNPERYSLELTIWKLESRIRLLVAQSAADKQAAMPGELTSLIQQRNEARLVLLKDERARLKARLERMDANIQQLEQADESLATQEAERLLNSVRSRSKSRNVTKSRNPGQDTKSVPAGNAAVRPSAKKTSEDQ